MRRTRTGFTGRIDKRLKTYYWVVTTDSNGHKKLVSPPQETEQQAYNLGYQHLSDYFEVVPIDTRDETKATRFIKGSMLKEPGGINVKVKHTEVE